MNEDDDECQKPLNIAVIPATKSFKLTAKNDLGESVMATPAVADGRLYIRGKSHLFCIGER